MNIKSVKLVDRMLKPFVEEGIIPVSDHNEILLHLKYLASKGKAMPDVLPKLIKMDDVASMLSLGLSNFKKLEKEGIFPFQRKTLGSSVRYRNTDIYRYILLDPDNEIPIQNLVKAS